MTWRVANLGGTLTVESYPNEGTVVPAIVPDVPEDEGGQFVDQDPAAR